MSLRRKRIVQAAAFVALSAIGMAAVIMSKHAADAPQPFDLRGKVAGLTSELSRTRPDGCPEFVFTDVAVAAGIQFVHGGGARSSLLPEDMGSGAAFADYDQDGDLDLFIANESGPYHPDQPYDPAAPGPALYQNQGTGKFTDVTAAAAIGWRGLGMGVAFGDCDGDGALDLYLSAVGPNVLWHNQRDGTFADVTARARVGDPGFGAGVTWLDYDLDGDLDLYVCNYVEFELDRGLAGTTTMQFGTATPYTLNPSAFAPGKNCLYRNDGDGTFTNVARELGVDNPTGRSLSAAACDFDNDGDPDLYVANDISANAFYRNDGGRAFTDITADSWATDYRGAMGLAVADFDWDGDFDIFVSHWVAQENSLFQNLWNDAAPGAQRGLHFMDQADMYGLGQISLMDVGWGTGFLDADNDGNLDLFVANGHTLQDEHDLKRLIPQQNRLFWNRGGQRDFFDVTETAGQALQAPNVGRGAVFADYDHDGDVDILLVRSYGHAALLRNDTRAPGRFLNVAVVGNGKNSCAIGARVSVLTGQVRRMQEVGSSPSYLSQNSYELSFGVGGAATVDELLVRWPDGVTRTFKDVATNAFVVVKPDGSIESRQVRS
ncbi:MAG: CRTAC1 family protein [Planctomycetota bacterium]